MMPISSNRGTSAKIARQFELSYKTARQLVGIVRAAGSVPALIFDPRTLEKAKIDRKRGSTFPQQTKTGNVPKFRPSGQPVDENAGELIAVDPAEVPAMKSWFYGRRAKGLRVVSLLLERTPATLPAALRLLRSLKAPAYLLIDGNVSAYRDGNVAIAAGPRSKARLEALGGLLRPAGREYEALPLPLYRIESRT